MMDIMPPSGHLPHIAKYGAGAFRVLEQDYAHDVLVSVHGVAPTTTPLTPENIIDPTTLLAHVDALPQPIEILLIGSGSRMIFMPPTAKAALRARGISVDVMDTGAACRTYNVLLGEGRPVAALLMAV